MTTTSITRYRTRPAEVTAIRWTGPDNCEQVFAFLGWEHSDNELDHDEVCGIGDNQTAQHGDWIVQVGEGEFRVLADGEFQAKYEAVPAPLNPLLDLTDPIERLELPLRARNRLRRDGIDTIGQLVGKTANDLMDIRAFGVGCLGDVVNALGTHGLKLADGTS